MVLSNTFTQMFGWLRMFLQHIDAIINAFTLPLAGICRISPLESFSLSLLFVLSPFFFFFFFEILICTFFPLLDVDTLDS